MIQPLQFLALWLHFPAPEVATYVGEIVDVTSIFILSMVKIE